LLVVAVPEAAGPWWTHEHSYAFRTEGRHYHRRVANNAGVLVAKPFTGYTDADFDLVTGVNLRGFFSVTRPAIAAMLRNNGTRRGHVVNISTSLVDHASTGRPATGGS
jgi:NAD(P)-dependent dehydrogenase (short-subunit alcohol dehydrogenase family)